MSLPFSRSIAMFALIRAAMQSANPQAAMAAIGPYKSHGKGRGTPSRRFFRGNHSKYMPHQGKQECARRMARMVTP